MENSDPKLIGAQARLEELGYKQELQRTLTVGGNVTMAVANASPVMAIFIFALAPLAVTGTASAAAAILQSILVIFIGIVLAELGALYPISGGLYSIVRHLLPRPLTFIAVLTFMLQAFIFPPSLALGVATYLQLLFPDLPQTPLATSLIAAIVLLVALLVGIKDIATSSTVTKILMLIQMAILGVFLFLCFTHTQRPLTELILSPQMLNETHTGLIATGFTGVLMSMGILFGVIDGYAASLGFAEETKGTSRNVGKAVLISAILTAVLMSITLLASMIAAPDLKEYLSAVSPLLYIVEIHGGPIITTLINVGVLLASFTALVVLIIYMARVFYTGARDRVWPDAVNHAVTKVSGSAQIPWVATLIIATVSIVMVFASSLINLVTFGSILIATVYLLIAIGAIVSRVKNPEIPRPFKMPLFPLPPIVVIVGLVVAISSQSLQDMVTAGIFYLVAFVYYFLYIRPRTKRESRHSQNL